MEDKIDNKEEQTELETDPDEEEKDDINIDDERERHRKNVFEDNEGGVDEKALLHAKLWDLYLNEKEKLVKDKYLVEVVGTIRKMCFGKWLVIMWWKIQVITKTSDLGCLIILFSIRTSRGVVREECSRPYLKMLIKLWPGD